MGANQCKYKINEVKIVVLNEPNILFNKKD